MVYQCVCIFIVMFVFVFVENWDKGLRKSVFGKYLVQQIGQFEGDEEGVGCEICVKGLGNYKILDKVQDVGEEGYFVDCNQCVQ